MPLGPQCWPPRRIFGLGRNSGSEARANYGSRIKTEARQPCAVERMLPSETHFPIPGLLKMHSLTFMRLSLPINPGFQRGQQLARTLESRVAEPGPPGHLQQHVRVCSNVPRAAALSAARGKQGQSLRQLRDRDSETLRVFTKAASQRSTLALLCALLTAP